MARPEYWKGETKVNAINEILERISEGESLRQIIADPKLERLPCTRLFYEWIKGDEKLSNNYARATDERAELIFEDLITISDNEYGDATRDRLRVDTRKWVLGRMKPKKYGDKLDLTSDGDKIQQTVIVLPEKDIIQQ
jgi:hypothetical protein